MILPHRERTSSIMASIKYDEYKVKLNNLKPTLDDLGQSLGLEAAAEELDLLQAQSAAEDFWNDMEKAQKVSQRIKNLQEQAGRPAEAAGHRRRSAGAVRNGAGSG